MKFLELASADLIAALGATACELQTGFLAKFTVHMMLIPVLLVISFIAYLVARVRASSSKTFTRDSALTGFYTVISFSMFTVYIGVSTRIFRLFQCQNIMGTWYLTADYSVKCFTPVWDETVALAYPCIVLFVVGIPAAQFLALFWNLKYLDESKCVGLQAHRRHMRVKRKYGSIFDAYTPRYYYFDLIDLLRRLLLTGGLVVAGSDQAVVQLLLGLLVSAVWLFAVLYLRPYKSTWDTLLSSILAFVVVLTLACGMALKLYQLTMHGSDAYQQNLFDMVLTTTVALTILCSVVAIVLSFDCMSERVALCMNRDRTSNATENDNKTKTSTSLTQVIPVSTATFEEEQGEKEKNQVTPVSLFVTSFVQEENEEDYEEEDEGPRDTF
jgi:hypothetical protein